MDLKKQQKNEMKKFFKKPGLLFISVVILIIGAIVVSIVLLSQGERINRGGYQAVYMTTGQVYFGKLRNTSGEYLVMETPYAPQNVQRPEAETNADSDANTTLLKVSEQQYGPEDVMSLKSDQVLFWQNLRQDSQVARAIDNQR